MRKKVAVIGCGALGTLVAEGVAFDLTERWELSGVFCQNCRQC